MESNSALLALVNPLFVHVPHHSIQLLWVEHGKIFGQLRVESEEGLPGELESREWYHSIQLNKQS